MYDKLNNDVSNLRWCTRKDNYKAMCVAECLQKNGYCVMQVPADGEARLSMFEFTHSYTRDAAR